MRRWSSDAAPGIEMSYDRIMPAVASGEVDAGLIIHESRFTYPEQGLIALVDLGEWWERTTASPIPLGGIVGRRSLGPELAHVDRLIRASVEYAFANPSASAAYVRSHAQELSERVTQSHIALYVNDASLDLGADGELAARELMSRARIAGLLPDQAVDLFATRQDI